MPDEWEIHIERYRDTKIVVSGLDTVSANKLLPNLRELYPLHDRYFVRLYYVGGAHYHEYPVAFDGDHYMCIQCSAHLPKSGMRWKAQ